MRTGTRDHCVSSMNAARRTGRSPDRVGDCAQHSGGDPRPSCGGGAVLAAAGIALSDRVLEAMLYAGPGSQRGMRRKTEPDWTASSIMS